MGLWAWAMGHGGGEARPDFRAAAGGSDGGGVSEMGDAERRWASAAVPRAVRVACLAWWSPELMHRQVVTRACEALASQL